MTMKYGQIAGNKSINAMIYQCFEYIYEEDKQKFLKKFKEQHRDSDQIMHTFRELVLGAYLSSKGFRVRYDYVIDKQTPDWSIFGAKGESIIGLVELTSLHIDKAAENEIEKQIRASGVAGYWRDKNKDNVERLYHVIRYKIQAYRSLIENLRVPYVVGVFGEFKVALSFEEVCLCLFDEKKGLFGIYPKLSGVLYFEESSGRYSFNYISNPNALQTIELPVGIFPLRDRNAQMNKNGSKSTNKKSKIRRLWNQLDFWLGPVRPIFDVTVKMLWFFPFSRHRNLSRSLTMQTS
jgi:hypothetical protein